MIEILIAVLLQIAVGTECEMGLPADYYSWVDRNPDYEVPLQVSVNQGDYWIMQGNDGSLLLFKFQENVLGRDKITSSHGECARLIK